MRFIGFFLTALFLASSVGCMKPRPTPVILDTDIGDDIDDTWALSLLLRCPELEPKLVVSDYNNTPVKAKILAKYLEQVGRTEISVGVGKKINDKSCNQQSWVQDYDLSKYPGHVYTDGVQALIDTVMNSPEPVTIIAIGPVSNLAEALTRQPAIVQRARLVLMGGSVEKQYENKPGRCPEYNVVCDAAAAQIAYQADWDVTLAPLDTAGVVRLTGQEYQAVRDATSPFCTKLIENYRQWAQHVTGVDPENASTILYDTVAVYLAVENRFCQMQDIRIRVTDQGLTEPHPDGKLMHVAMNWKDQAGFQRFLVDRLVSAR